MVNLWLMTLKIRVGEIALKEHASMHWKYYRNATGISNHWIGIWNGTVRPFQLVFLFLVRVFQGIDMGGQVLSNLETKYFDTKQYSSLTPYTTAK